MAASQLKLRPILDTSETSVHPPSPPSTTTWIRRALPAAAVGIACAFACKAALVAARYVQAEGTLVIEAISADRQETILARHLGRLYLSSLAAPSSGPGRPANVVDLVAAGRLNIFAVDERTIKLTAQDRSEPAARQWVERIRNGYISAFKDLQERQVRRADQQSHERLTHHKQLRESHQQLQRQLSAFQTKTSKDKSLDQAIVSLGKKLDTSLTQMQALNERLIEIKDQMYRAEAELRRPTVHVDPGTLRRAAMTDKLFAGDHRMLTTKHARYVAAFKGQLTAADRALTAVRRHLRTISTAVSEQLELDLPAELADDLLELNLAAELYAGQLANYDQRWQRYQATMLDMLAEPQTADYDGMQTVLSSVRQDLIQRCGELPKQVQTLFDRLKAGPKGDARRPGGLSRATVRNIATSAIQYDLEQVLEAWRALVRGVDRLFPESNVTLRTLARVCRSLQTRLLSKERQIKQRLKREYLVAAKRRASERLSKLQSDFQRAGAELTVGFETLAVDQRVLCKLSATWPEWQRLARQMDVVRLDIRQTEASLAGQGVEVWSEQLTPAEVVVRRLSHAGIFGRHENTTTAGVGILLALLAHFVLAAKADRKPTG